MASLFLTGKSKARKCRLLASWWRFCALSAIVISPAFPWSASGSDLRVVSSFVAVGELAPAECTSEIEAFAHAIAGRPQPLDWHWVLVCDQAGWNRFLRLSGRAGQEEILASTDLAARTTYLRGDKLLHPKDFATSPIVVIGHELAHIQLQTGDEFAAERLNRAYRAVTPSH